MSRNRKSVGYVFGYGSLVDPNDHLRRALRSDAYPAVDGFLDGYRRRWTAGMENRDQLNDKAHYLDPATGERLDVCVVALSADPAPGRIGGVAFSVTEADLERLDLRELHYDRIDVTSAFRGNLGEQPIWTYTANELARDNTRCAAADKRLVASQGYWERIQGAFRETGGLPTFETSTDQPPCPLVALRHVASRDGKL